MSLRPSMVCRLCPILLLGLLGVRAAAIAAPASTALPGVELVKAPAGGIQPQAAADSSGIRLVYLSGDPGAADIFYTRRKWGSARWSTPLRVNTRPGSAVAVGTIRGAQLALGKSGRAHVVWFGSDHALPGGNGSQGAPLLYSRLNDAGKAFEPERKVNQFTVGLDGGPSVAADRSGNVYVAWHSGDGTEAGEVHRRLWVSRSRDEGRTFSREAPAWAEPTGACGCCGARAFADHRGSLYVLYRAATGGVDRDMVLLTSGDRGTTFGGTRLHPWKLNACPMSSESFAESPAGVLAAWETRGQVYFTRVDPATEARSPLVAPPGGQGDRKHPALAADRSGNTLLAWAEGTGWKKGGDLAWQLFDRSGRPTAVKGRMKGAVPVWGLATVVARPRGGFTVIY